MAGNGREERFDARSHDIVDILQVGQTLLLVHRVNCGVEALNDTRPILFGGPTRCGKVLCRLADYGDSFRGKLRRYADPHLLCRIKTWQHRCRICVDPSITGYPSDQLVEVGRA